MLFEKFVDNYARLRPGYPSDLIESLIDSLRINNRSMILDLACGTGNLAKSLSARVKPNIICLDHSLTMLRYNRIVARLNAVAEALPLKSAAFDGVLIGQAFHWFDFDRALNEIARILKRGAGFAIIWYRRARPIDGYRLKLDELVRSYNPGYKPGFMDFDWASIISSSGLFSKIKSFKTRCRLEYPIEDYLKLQRTKSYIGDAMTAENLSGWLNQAADILNVEFTDGVVRERMQYFYVSAVKV